jgi:hypothetical protein
LNKKRGINIAKIIHGHVTSRHSSRTGLMSGDRVPQRVIPDLNRRGRGGRRG